MSEEQQNEGLWFIYVIQELQDRVKYLENELDYMKKLQAHPIAVLQRVSTNEFQIGKVNEYLGSIAMRLIKLEDEKGGEE
jgi:hypothetical protein